MSNRKDPNPNRRALSDGMWTVMERVLSQFGQLAIFVTAARVLTPAEFGIFALTSACAILLLRFAEVGWAQYIMSWSGTDEIPRQVLFVAIVFGACAALLGLLVGLGFSLFETTPDAGILIMLFAIWVLLATTSSAQKGILIWQNKLRASAICEIAGEITGLAVALSALISGYGVLALVFGRIAMQSVHLGLSFAFTRLSPKRGMSADQLRDLKDYSIPLFSSRMTVNFRLYAATFIIGGFLGTAAVGYYRAAERLVSALTEVVAVPSQVLAWSLFRQARENHNGTLAGFQKQAEVYFHVLFLTALPIFVWASVFAKDLINGLLGPEWQPAIPIVIILALARAISLPTFASEPILSLAGEIRRLPKVSVIFLILTIVLNLIASPFGMVAVAWAQVIGSVIVTVIMLWLTRVYGAVVWRDVVIYSRRIIPPLILSTVVLILLRDLNVFAELPGLLRITAASIPTVLLYAAALCVFDPNLRSAATSYVKRKTGSAPKP
ncbi:oligosaccharide flippase family protein [Roseobacter sp. N2S]|uniref:oligosaccharide flippase family protein n=1 Tax=Roseobacter sp. N2S TaxID=2663844 RepID=UPI00285C6344|nr:oligosaccharide flippase family protein [Roseobacter sp. N2S]MDR6264515.1 O-antigen/teichoic acid export membrane protein [Roseobacter sp. N2S]